MTRYGRRANIHGRTDLEIGTVPLPINPYKSLVCDWRNAANWSAADRSRRPDVWSFGGTTDPAVVAGLPGKKLFAYQPGVLFNADGDPAGALNELLYDALNPLGAVTDMVMWTDGTSTLRMTDMAIDGVPRAIATVILNRYGAIGHGTHHDYWNRLLWLFPHDTPGDEDPVTYWPKYGTGLAMMVEFLHHDRPDWLVVGQQYMLDTDDRMNRAVNGLWTEQYIEFGPSTRPQHIADRAAMLALQTDVRPARESLWVMELRNLAGLGSAYLTSAVAWCRANEFTISYGRDATARVAP